MNLTSARRWAGSHPIFRALHSRNYRLFFGGQSVSLIGTWMTSTATASLIQYRLHGTGSTLGYVAFAARIPAFFMAPLAGVMTDRWNLRRLLVGTQTLAMIQSFLLAYVALTRPTVGQLIGLSVFQGLIDGFDMPARQTFIIGMVERRQDLPNAIALNSSMVHLARFMGPAIAGVLIGIWGEASCFLVDGFSYLAVIASLLAMVVKPTPRRADHPPVLQGLKEGVSYAWRAKPLRAVLLMVTLMAVMGTPYITLMPIFADHFRPGNQPTYALLMSGSGLGALCGAVFLAQRKSAAGLDRVMPIAAGGFGLALLAFAFSPSLYLSVPLVVVAGFTMMVNMASGNTILQTLVHDDKRGRVMSLFTMSFMGAMPIGALIGGKLADYIGASYAVALGAVMCLAGAAAFATQGRLLNAALEESATGMGETTASGDPAI